jgi:hypothetical protein
MMLKATKRFDFGQLTIALYLNCRDSLTQAPNPNGRQYHTNQSESTNGPERHTGPLLNLTGAG